MCPRASRPLITRRRGNADDLSGWCRAQHLRDCGQQQQFDHHRRRRQHENYTVGGTISGLSVSSVVLANGTATVTVAADATSWSLSDTPLPPGSSYSVTVKTQPTGELCEVTSGGSGTDTGSVGNVAVVCVYGQWTSEGRRGLTVNASGVYGTQGTASAGNTARARAIRTSSWTDSIRQLLAVRRCRLRLNRRDGLPERSVAIQFRAAGCGPGSVAATRTMPAESTARWAPPRPATCRERAIRPAPGPTRPATCGCSAGYGYDATGAVGNLNDLWRFSPSTGLWTWVSGGNTDNASGVYGTQGTAAAGNVPGARYAATSWIDSSGNLWLFGGVWL
jgi:hypothetical protein